MLRERLAVAVAVALQRAVGGQAVEAVAQQSAQERQARRILAAAAEAAAIIQTELQAGVAL